MPKAGTIDTAQELVMMRMSLNALRERIIEDLSAMDANIAALIPEDNKSRHRSSAEIKRRSQEIFDSKFPKK